MNDTTGPAATVDAGAQRADGSDALRRGPRPGAAGPTTKVLRR